MNLQELQGMFASADEDKPAGVRPEPEDELAWFKQTVAGIKAGELTGLYGHGMRLGKSFSGPGDFQREFLLSMEYNPERTPASKIIMTKTRSKQPLTLKNGSFVIYDELQEDKALANFYDRFSTEYPAEFTEENWAKKRGLKGSLQPKKANNPKGNALYGTGWSKAK